MIHESSYNVVMTWGKYKGQTLGKIYEINESYLTWMSEAAGVPVSWKVAALRTINGEDLTDLSLPRVLPLNKSNSSSPMSLPNDKKIAIDIIKTKAIVTFPYRTKTLSTFESAVESRVWDGDKKLWKMSIPDIAKRVKAFGVGNVILTESALKAYESEGQRRKH